MSRSIKKGPFVAPELFKRVEEPLCEPPFPIERIEELTACMASDGRIR